MTPKVLLAEWAALCVLHISVLVFLMVSASGAYFPPLHAVLHIVVQRYDPIRTIHHGGHAHVFLSFQPELIEAV